MAKIIYITDARLPTEKAHGLQIMKTCEALVRAGNSLTLVTPRRRNSITTDLFSYYKITHSFPVRRLLTLDLIPFGRIGFLVQVCTFALVASCTLVRDGYDPDATSDAIYFNDAESAAFVPLDKALYRRIQKGQIRL